MKRENYVHILTRYSTYWSESSPTGSPSNALQLILLLLWDFVDFICLALYGVRTKNRKAANKLELEPSSKGGFQRAFFKTWERYKSRRHVTATSLWSLSHWRPLKNRFRRKCCSEQDPPRFLLNFPVQVL